MNKLFGLTWLLLFCLLGVSCSDDEDRLTNKWQLRSYQHDGGEVEEVGNVFYNFQKGTFSAIVRMPDEAYTTFFGNYTLNGAQLSITLLPEYEENALYKEYVGWEDGSRTFTIEELSGSSLQLKYEDIVYNFRTY